MSVKNPGCQEDNDDGDENRQRDQDFAHLATFVVVTALCRRAGKSIDGASTLATENKL